MKRFCAVVLAAMVAVGTMAGGALANQGIYGIWWNLDESNDNGYGFGFRSKVPIAPLVSFDTRVSWIKFNDSDTSIIPIEATGMLKLGMMYAGVGVGYYFFDASGGVDIDNNFGWYLLGGIDISAGPVGIFGEFKWTSLSTDVTAPAVGAPGARDTPTSLDADGIGLNVGVMFGVPKL
jgi:hypothetical protein